MVLQKIKEKIIDLLTIKQEYKLEKLEMFEIDKDGNELSHWILDEKTNEWRKING